MEKGTGDIKRELAVKKLKLNQYLRGLTPDNTEDFYIKKFQDYLYYTSETVTMENGETIPKGLMRFLMTLPAEASLPKDESLQEDKQPTPNIKGAVRVDGKTKDGFNIKEREFCKREIAKLTEMAEGVDLMHDINLEYKFGHYMDFLGKRINTARSEQADAGDIKEIGISSSPPTEQPGSGDGNLPDVVTPKYEIHEISKVLENYTFWNDVNTGVHGHRNILDGISEQQFIDMVHSADFTAIGKIKNITQRVKYNICVLARLMGTEWGEDAASKLNTTLRTCGKCTNFAERERIKSMYLQ